MLSPGTAQEVPGAEEPLGAETGQFIVFKGNLRSRYDYQASQHS